MKDRQDESMTTRRLSRRDFLGRAAAVAALTGVAGPLAACQPPEETGGAAGTDLDFVIWSYNVGTVQDNVNRFQKKYPKFAVELRPLTSTPYHDTMVNRFEPQTAMEV